MEGTLPIISVLLVYVIYSPGNLHWLATYKVKVLLSSSIKGRWVRRVKCAGLARLDTT